MYMYKYVHLHLGHAAPRVITACAVVPRTTPGELAADVASPMRETVVLNRVTTRCIEFATIINVIISRLSCYIIKTLVHNIIFFII